jgi:hypothetical protein
VHIDGSSSHLPTDLWTGLCQDLGLCRTPHPLCNSDRPPCTAVSLTDRQPSALHACAEALGALSGHGTGWHVEASGQSTNVTSQSLQQVSVPQIVMDILTAFSYFFVIKFAYRPSNRRLSSKLVPTFADRGCRVVSATDPHGRLV